MDELSPEEFAELIRKAEAGDEAAADALVAVLEDSEDPDRYEALAPAVPPAPPEPPPEDTPLSPSSVPPHLCATRVALHNFAFEPPPTRIATPKTNEDVTKQMKEAVEAWRTMRATGAEYAFSNVVHTRDWWIKSTQLNTELIERVPTEELVEPRDDLFRVGAGVTVELLNEALSKLDPPRVMMNMPGYEKLSMVGVMSVGGHGAGVGYGPLCEHVESVDLFHIDGESKVQRLRIERPPGLTRPGPTPCGIDEVIRDDRALFDACRVGIGMLGVITSVVVRTQLRTMVREDRKVVPWEKFRDEELPELLQRATDETQTPGTVHSHHLWICPYPTKLKPKGADTKTKNVWCTHITYRWEKPDEPRKRRKDVLWIFVKLGQLVLRAARLGKKKRLQRVARLLAVGLKTVGNLKSVLPFEEAVNFGDTNRSPVMAASCAIDAERTAEHIDKLLQHFQCEGKKGNVVTSPIGLRWVAASNALLAPQYGRRSCMIEVPMLVRKRDVELGQERENAVRMLESYLEFATKNLDARPHWGQRHKVTAAQIRAMYPDTFDTFREQFLKLNPNGFFDNELTDQLELRDA